MNKVSWVNQVVQVRKVFLLLILAFSLLVCGCGNSQSGEEIFQKSCEAMEKVKGLSFKADINLTMPIENTKKMGDLSCSLNGETDSKNFHATMNMDMSGQKFSSEIYGVEEKDTVIMYMNVPFVGWQKTTAPVDSQMQNETFNLAKYMDEYTQKESKIKIVGEEEASDKAKLTILEVKIKTDSISEEFLQNFVSSPKEAEQAKEILASVGEIKYKMWVRADNYYVSKIEFNLTDLFKGLAKSKNATAELKKTYGKTSGKLVMDFYNYDQVQEIVVPKDVKKKAKAM